MKYAFIEMHRSQFTVRTMCRMLRVHPSGLYAWLKRPFSKRAREDQRQTGLIKEAWQDSGKVYGYRDWRAIICCCTPLLLATFLGYWFMTALNIGLKVSTLPVLVLATGIGVDHAFYIYSRLQALLDEGFDIVEAYSLALQQIGVAVVFTGLILSVGVSSWAFSGLKLQADMGLLLSFMFLANMIAAIVFLPAFATILERLFPRKRVR